MLQYAYPMKSAKLTEFLDLLNSLDTNGFKGKVVDRYLTENFIPNEEFIPYIFFREDTYGRNLIARNEYYELLALTWLPNQRTKIHDHFGQRCWMTVQLGALMTKNYELPKSEKGDLIPMGSTETCAKGQGVYIDDSIGIHSITNASKKPAVSIHLYAAPIPRCRTFNESSKCFEWNELQYFTQYGQEFSESSPDLDSP